MAQAQSDKRKTTGRSMMIQCVARFDGIQARGEGTVTEILVDDKLLFLHADVF